MKYEFESDDELRDFLAASLIGTSEATEILNCSRQNIADLIRRGKLKPIVNLHRDRLFLKSDILTRVKASE